MNKVSDFLTYNLDIIGTVILFVSLFPVIKLMKELPSGSFRKWWGVMMTLILFFIVCYIYCMLQHHYDSDFNQNEIVPYILSLDPSLSILLPRFPSGPRKILNVSIF